MITLKQQIQEAIDTNIPKYTKEFRRNLTNVVLEAFKKGLMQNRQERECNDFSKDRFQILAFYDELLEELEK